MYLLVFDFVNNFIFLRFIILFVNNVIYELKLYICCILLFERDISFFRLEILFLSAFIYFYKIKEL